MTRRGLAGLLRHTGGRSVWRCLVLLGVAAAVTVLLAGHPALATPATAPAAPPVAVQGGGSPVSAALPSRVPVGQGSMVLAAGAPGTERTQKEQLRKTLMKLGVGKGDLLDSFQVTNDIGIPVSAFTVDVDSGSWDDWDLKVEAWLTSLLFMGVKWLVAFACWLLTWALGFKLAEALLRPAVAVSDSLYSHVLLSMGLPSLFLVFSGVTAAWHLWFGRRSRGWGELLASLMIGALAATSLASPPQQLLGPQDGAVGKARELGIAVASVVMGQDDPTAADPLYGIVTPITDQMVDAFVVQPAMVLSYGRTFTNSGEKKCAWQFVTSRIGQAIYNQKLADANKDAKDVPSGGDLLVPGLGGKFTDLLREKGLQWVTDSTGVQPGETFEKTCVGPDAKVAKKASVDKLVGAGFMLVAALLLCALIIALAAGYLTAQAWLAIEAMLLRCALIAGTLPGPGRAWLWSRAAAIARGLALLVTLVIALAVFVVCVTAVLAAQPQDIPGGIIVRFVLVDILCAAAIVFRKRLMRATSQGTARLRSRLGASPLGGSNPPAALGPVGGRRRGTLGKVVGAGLMLGAMAATGGAAGALGGVGRATSARALSLRLARGAGSLARGTQRAMRAGGRAGLRLGRFGLQSTVGLPVYGPRAARTAATAVQAVPGQVATAASQLTDRLEAARALYEPQARELASGWFAGVGGHWLRNQALIRNGMPPLPARPRPARGTSGTRATVPPRGRMPRPGPAPAAPRPAAGSRSSRARRVPQRPLTPPASSQQASLQQRLHRMRTRAPANPAPGPHPGRTGTPPAAPRRPNQPPRRPRRRS
ncbi:hypothetical protein [Streptomyces sp. NPDC093097]|uniref:hypothetical protein n=1 Tax=Streptomyces sp. NPDC093097 TaxID=3366027 RepID=UPI0038291D72